MFELNINSTPVFFSKFFNETDREQVLAAIPERCKRVVFLDTPATKDLIATVLALTERGVNVYVRDHHDEPNPQNPRAQQIAAAANELREILGERAVISNRRANPACSSLIDAGEFAGEDAAIVADPDLDGLTAAMKAVGVVYPQLDADAEIFDTRPRQSAETLSEVGWLAVRGLATLPPFNAKSEDAKRDFFAQFVAASQGDMNAVSSLQTRVAQYEASVAEAEKLAREITEPLPGIALVDVCGASRYDLNTLNRAMEATGAMITVIRKDIGPIAAQHGVQYSLAVVDKYQKDLNLQEFLPNGFESSPEAGIISNTTFLLHVSERVWEDVVLPELESRLGPQCEQEQDMEMEM